MATDDDLEAIKRVAHELGNVAAALECQWFVFVRNGASEANPSLVGLSETIDAVLDAARRLRNELSRIDSTGNR